MMMFTEIRHCRGGFTLIEILVATAILAMIFTIVFGTFFYTVDIAEEQEERAALYHRANFILNNISQGVSSAYVPFGGAYPDTDDEKSVFLGTIDSIENSEAVSLSTFTTNPRFGENGTAGQIAYVSYRVASSSDVDAVGLVEDENNPLVLGCFVEPLLSDPKTDDEEEARWSLNIHSLSIEYSDGSGWLREWDYEDQGVLPDAVRLELALADSIGNTHSFSTVANIHVNTLLEEPSEAEEEKIEEEEESEEPEEEEEATEKEETERTEQTSEDKEPGFPSPGDEEPLFPETPFPFPLQS